MKNKRKPQRLGSRDLDEDYSARATMVMGMM
jgi:hypothetical protein